MIRFIVILAVLIAGFMTALMNARFSYQLGTDPLDKYALAVFAVALDLCKWFILAVTVNRTKPQRMAGFLIWTVATVYSFMAAIGFAALNRDSTAGERAGQVELHKTIQLMKTNVRWKDTAACTNATTKKSKTFCDEYRQLAGKLHSAPVSTDPQSALFARLTGYTEDQVRIGLAVFLAIACEIISALGLYAIVNRSPAGTQMSTKVTALRPRLQQSMTQGGNL